MPRSQRHEWIYYNFSFLRLFFCLVFLFICFYFFRLLTLLMLGQMHAFTSKTKIYLNSSQLLCRVFHPLKKNMFVVYLWRWSKFDLFSFLYVFYVTSAPRGPSQGSFVPDHSSLFWIITTLVNRPEYLCLSAIK